MGVTLNALFRLNDGYSTVINRINKRTDEATNKMLKASGSTDKFNAKLNATGASANTASGGIGKLIGAVVSLAAVQKGMSIADEYTNTSSRLALINDGLQTQAELQEKIFASADRAKGSYTVMAGAISKMGLMAKESFGSNDELIAFTELIQKGFKVGGSSATEQSSAMLQLTQAMGAGKLQGDEFRSIMENAPMIADAIAKYTGKTKGQLKEMSSDGLISSDIIKNAMFMASDDINKKFKTMPLTFADIWNKIKNGGLHAFDRVIKKVNTLINTKKFQKFIDDMVGGFNLVAGVVSFLIDVIIDGWDVIKPILVAIGGIYLSTIIAKLWATIPPLVAQATAWLAIYWPIVLVIGIIAAAIWVLRQFGVTWDEIFGAAGGTVSVFTAGVFNNFVYMWNQVAAFVNFFGNVFKNPIAAVNIMFLDLAIAVLGYMNKMTQGIEDAVNKIPGVKIDVAKGTDTFLKNLQAETVKLKGEAEWKEYAKPMDYLDYSKSYEKGSKAGTGILDTMNGAKNAFSDALDNFGKGSSPISVEGKGKNKKVEVDMADEDLQYLRDIAERDYINKFSTATLAPNVTFNISDIKETADVNKLKGTLEMMMREEIAVAAEGVY